MIPFVLILCKVWYLTDVIYLFIFVWEYPITPWVEKAIFIQLSCLFIFVKNWLRILVELSGFFVLCLWPKFSSLHQYLRLMITEVIMKFWIMDWFLPFILLYQNDLTTLIYLSFHINFMITLSICTKNSCRDYNHNCFKSAYQFEENQHVYYVEFSNPCIQYVPIYLHP